MLSGCCYTVFVLSLAGRIIMGKENYAGDKEQSRAYHGMRCGGFAVAVCG